MAKYQVILYWSDEDGAFIAELPELPGAPRTVAPGRMRSRP